MTPRGGNNYELNCNLKSLVNTIRENLVLRILKSKGYKFVNLSIWPELEEKSDYHFDHDYLVDRFAMELLNRTILSKPVIENVIVGLEERKMDRMKLRALAEVPGLSAPTFTYVHFYATHSPYVLDENGNKIALARRIFESSTDRSLFQKQLTFVSTQVRGAIENIIQKSPRPPIIIVQGDHGPQVSSESINLQMSILNAFYLPGMRSDSLPQDISPVNNFRVMFNRCFNMQLDLLENKHYYPTRKAFAEISAKLK